MATAREQCARQALGDAACNRIKQCKVLLVGAGGIGCELLKNLVLMNFGEIHVIDLDTIDLSNLNRQFLFGREHIKKPKALVAKETASTFNPDVSIIAYQANITDAQFSVGWFRSFDLVYNALDNVEARRHVNRMCLRSQVPLIESGTAGFNGQVQVIVGGKTECYDCNPKPVTKSFPVCTIRSTPSQPIHCIVWAKSYLFSQLFEAEEDTEEAQPGEDAVELEKLQKEANELKNLQERLFGDSDDFAKAMFEKVFKADIERLRSMDSMWKTRKPPVPLSFDELVSSSAEVSEQNAADDQQVPSLEQSFVLLNSSLATLRTRIKELRETDPKATISFDKDDLDTLQFVAAAANIRSHVFSIPVKSIFDIKQIAGNIIPAIATTNAIIAGVCVLQSLIVLDDKLDEGRNVFLSRLPERVFTAERLQPPNPECVVSGIARTSIKTDPSKLTLGTLVDSLLKLDLGYTEELSVVTDQLIYDPDFQDNLEKTLAELHITDGSFLTVIDEEDDGKVNLELYVEEAVHDGEYVLESKPDIPLKLKKPETEPEPEPTEQPAKKRKLEDEGDGEQSNGKRAKIDGAEDAPIEIDDEGVILIDDDEVELID